jgi:hypothetical protein
MKEKFRSKWQSLVADTVDYPLRNVAEMWAMVFNVLSQDPGIKHGNPGLKNNTETTGDEEDTCVKEGVIAICDESMSSIPIDCPSFHSLID